MINDAPRMHDDEVAIDENLVRRLLSEQFPRLAGLEVQRVASSGTDNALFRLGADMALRLPRHEPTAGQPTREARWLPHLFPSFTLEVPEPLGLGVPGCGYPFDWSVCRWIEGEEARADAFADPCATARELARFILALEAAGASGGPRPGRRNFGRGGPLSWREEGFRRSLAALADEVDAKTCEEAWREALAAPQWPREGVWIHGDLQASNLIVREGRLVGVIDFGCLALGDPACELMAAWALFEAASRRAFVQALPFDEATWARARGWVVSGAVIGLAYYRRTNPAIVERARTALAAVLSTR
ncbi:MAG: aminoglycoside phosphotransferase family protein [Caulobacteraceae bacterium]